MVTTNVTNGGHFLVTSTDPGGEWSEPIWIKHPGIDPSLFFDDDGLAYFTCNGPGPYPTTIYQSIIDLSSGEHLSTPRTIWDGTGGMYPEAPHLYKIDGLYYLLLAEGGTGAGHMVTIARSNSPWGPFEACAHNPILSHRSRFSPIQATGHGDLIQAHDGSWWMVFLGIRPRGNGWPPTHHLGRETFLTPIIWRDGWPQVEEEGMVSLEMESPTLRLRPGPADPVRDDFDDGQLGLVWNFVRNPSPAMWSLSARPGWLTLFGLASTLDEVDTLAFVGRRQQHFSCRAATLLDFEPGRNGDEAGLALRMNERHHYEIFVARVNGQRSVCARQRIGDLVAIIGHEPLVDGNVILAVEADPDSYCLYYEQEGARVNLAYGSVRHLSTEVAGGFTGVYIGMYANGNGAPNAAPAYFDWFDYLPLMG
jgi:alpha-N-arabinofuranosidase